MKVETRGNITSLYFDVSTGWEQKFMLMSDGHIDSKYCNRELLFRHLDLAKRYNALIMDFGDLFDAMQGKFDPRRSSDELRPEYLRSDYYDFVVTDVADLLEPYAKNIVLLGLGNHETGVIKNANTNLTDRLVYELNHRGASIVPGAYGGWVRFMFNISGRPQCSKKLYYHHGYGGEAPVTKGVNQTARQAEFLPDADIVVNGHNHNAYHVPRARKRISNKGVEYYDNLHFIRTPGYKRPADARFGFDVERLPTPKSNGCVWMTMRCEKNNQIDVEFTLAIA